MSRHGDHEEEEVIYERLPSDIRERFVLLLDPLVGTGRTACRAVQVSAAIMSHESMVCVCVCVSCVCVCVLPRALPERILCVCGCVYAGCVNLICLLACLMCALHAAVVQRNFND